MTNSDAEGERRKMLLIFPITFYSFADGILKALSAGGYDAVLANHEYPSGMLGKILGNLKFFRMLSFITERVLYRDYIAGKRYDLVLIVKGRGVSRKLIEKLRHVTPRIVAYNFDSFGYNPSPLRWYKYVDKYCTFDYLDSQNYSIPLVELFSSVPVSDAPKQNLYDISAILRNHSNRLKYLDFVLNALPKGKTFIYILELNVLTFFWNFIKNPLLYMKYRSNIHFKPLPYTDYVSVLKNSSFTLDYAHPSQSGTTIRCFEALSTQTKIITNNRFVTRSSLFNEDNTVIVDEKTDVFQMRQRFHSVRNAIPTRHHRTIETFLEDLLA